MSTETTTIEVPVFATVAAFVEHLKGLPTDEVSRDYVVSNLEEISNRPVTAGKRRGQLAGLELETMTDEQLKREVINANSVLYKATQRGAAAETIAKNQARVDAVKAELAKRKPEVEVPATDASATDTGVASDEQHDVANEL